MDKTTVGNNYAFIDGQNLNSGIEAAGWKLDYRKFRDYLAAQFGVKNAIIFLGFMEEYQSLYSALQQAGFILHFKPLIRHEDSVVKGNVDSDIVLQTMIDIDRYDQAVIVSGDGDFASLIRHLANNGKLRQVIIPNRRTYSSLFRRLDEYGDKYFTFLEDLRSQLSYKPRPKNIQSQEPKPAQPVQTQPAPAQTPKPEQPKPS